MKHLGQVMILDSINQEEEERNKSDNVATTKMLVHLKLV